MGGIFIAAIVIVLILGVVAYFVLRDKSNATKPEINASERLVKEDGPARLSEEEREMLRQMAEEQGLDFNEVLQFAEQQLSGASTEQEGQSEQNRKRRWSAFERYIVQRFNRKFFRRKAWAGDQAGNEKDSERAVYPGFLFEFRMMNKKVPFILLCKWQKEWKDNQFVWEYPEQLEWHRNYEKDNKVPAFAILGVGGKAASPKEIFVLPLSKLTHSVLPKKELEPYAKKVGSRFFFDMAKNELT